MMVAYETADVIYRLMFSLVYLWFSLWFVLWALFCAIRAMRSRDF